ncbi:uridine phosphorylase, partial [Francisella tularensis subsp. holarctica]|nr:uridine phosphorylase [Francisella tularensis subsp. holarctica]
ANKRVAKSDDLYHIALSEEMINSETIAILPGDPKRSEYLAKMLDTDATFLASNREYTSYLSKVSNQNFILISTCMVR